MTDILLSVSHIGDDIHVNLTIFINIWWAWDGSFSFFFSSWCWGFQDLSICFGSYTTNYSVKIHKHTYIQYTFCILQEKLGHPFVSWYLCFKNQSVCLQLMCNWSACYRKSGVWWEKSVTTLIDRPSAGVTHKSKCSFKKFKY